MLNTNSCQILSGSKAIRRPRGSRLAAILFCVKAFACLTLCGVFLPVPCLAQGQATWSKAALLAAAEERQDAIKSLSVAFSFDIVEGPLFGMSPVAQYEIAFEGDKFLMTRALLLDPADKTLSARWVSWDGVVNCGYNTIKLPKGKIRHMAGITGEPSGEIWNTQGLPFFDMNLLNAPRDPDGGSGGDYPGDQSLVSLLRAQNAEVRDQTEIINGRECHVVDLIDVQSGRPRLTVWLDAERNVLPMRQQFFMGPGYPDLLMEFEVTVPYLTEAGIWLATEGTKRNETVPDVRPVAGAARKWHFQVAGDPQNDPQLSINRDYDDGLFRVWEYVPPGTHVTDFRTGESWLAQANDVKNIADVFLASLPEYKGPGPNLTAFAANRQDVQSASIIGSFLDLRWIAVIIVSVIAAVGIARFLALRRARPAA